MLILDVANYLQDKGIGTVGQDIFCSFLPDLPDDCISLFEYFADNRPLHWPGEIASLQVLTRSKNYEAGRLQAERVVQALHGLSGQMLGSTRYLLIQAKQSPYFLERDSSDRAIFVVNFKILKEQEAI